jgi:hypothetical protein
VIVDQSDIRAPQFLEQKAARIGGGGGQIAWTRAEAETIEGCHRPTEIRPDRHCRLATQQSAILPPCIEACKR